MARSAHAYVRGSTEQVLRMAGQRRGARCRRARRSGSAATAIWAISGPLANAKGRVGDADPRSRPDGDRQSRPRPDPARPVAGHRRRAGRTCPASPPPRCWKQIMAGYQAALAAGATRTRTRKPRSVRLLMRRALGRRWRHLAEERIEDVRARDPAGREILEAGGNERDAIAALFQEEPIREMVTALNQRDDDAAIEVLGRGLLDEGLQLTGPPALCGAAAGRRGRQRRSSTYALVDIKEAAKSAAAARAERQDAAQQRRAGGGRRQRRHPISAGGCGRPTAGRPPVFLRELMPQDLKLEIDQLTPDEAMPGGALSRRRRRPRPWPADGRVDERRTGGASSAAAGPRAWTRRSGSGAASST